MPGPFFATHSGGERCVAERVGQNVMRGPMNHWVSPSTNFTSPLRPQVGLNFTSAPRRP